MSGWIDQINGRGPWDVGVQLGLVARGRHLGPCPACGEDRRSKSDARKGAIFLVGKNGWKCGYCGVGGAAVQLAEYRIVGSRLPAGDPRWRELRADLAARGLCDPHEDAPRVAPRRLEPVRVPPAEEAPVRPDSHEVATLWRWCRPVDSDDGVAGWLRSRGLDPAVVARLDLARALPEGGERLPRWAHVRVADRDWRPWSAGWRCVLPAWAHDGSHASFRARWVGVDRPPGGAQKTAAAAAGPRSSVGMVLADAVARQVLEGAAPPVWWPPDVPLRLVVVEGEPDWLTWSCRVAADVTDAGVPSAGVIGLWNGSWTDEMAARIPHGTEVVVQTHDDADGHRYRDRVYATLRDRCRVLVMRRAA